MTAPRPVTPRRVRAARVIARRVTDGGVAVILTERVRMVSWHPWGPDGARPRWEWRPLGAVDTATGADR